MPGNGKQGKRENGKTVSLSKRMQMLADMVTAGSRVADVGCDHAFLSIYLVQTGKSPKCLAMDVRKGPLRSAGEHIASCGLGEYIETRLSDGLAAYHIGEAQSLVCAGMGGRLMEKILRSGGGKTRSFSELILQPQSEIPEFRRYLKSAGFLIRQEEAVCEEGKYYFAMKAVYGGGKPPETSAGPEMPGGQEPSVADLYGLYGEQLLQGRHPVLKQYLLGRMGTVDEIISRLRQKGTARSKARLEELCLEREQMMRALDFFGKGR